MFFLREHQDLWCLPCGMEHFQGIGGDDATPENISSCIINVRHMWESNKHGGVLEEEVNGQHLGEAKCTGCGTPLTQLCIVQRTFHGEKRFMPSYSVTELLEYQLLQASGASVSPPDPEWVPTTLREAHFTDLDPSHRDRRNYIPFEVVPVLVRNTRVLVVIDEKNQVHGTLVYVTNNDFALIQPDDLPHSQREDTLVIYPLNFPGLYLDGASSAHYQTICELRDRYSFQCTFSLVSEEERREQAPAPYMWKFTIVDPEQRQLNGVADTYREAIEQIYLTLCLQGYIDDPYVEKPSDSEGPF